MSAPDIPVYTQGLLDKYKSFKTKNNNTYIEIPCTNGSDKCTPVLIGSEKFHDHVVLDYLSQYGKAIPPTQMASAIRVLEAKIRQESPFAILHSRVAYIDDCIYINIDGRGSALKINKNGLKRVKSEKCKFNHHQFALPFPKPDIDNASIKPLWNMINITNIHDKRLIIVWLLNTFFANSNNPIPVFIAGKGRAKSYTQKILKQISDPSETYLRVAPKKPDDIAIAAANDYVLSYNNISKLSDSMQDDICQVSTGGIYANRKLFTNRSESISSIKSPIMMNGIGKFITKTDLQDRCLFFHLKKIPKTERRREHDLDAYFQKHKSKIFGWIVTSLIAVMNCMDTIEHPEELERMADFCYFGHVVEKALVWKKGAFKKAFNSNLKKHTQAYTIQPSPVAIAIIELMNNKDLPFKGTMKELLNQLNTIDPSIEISARKLSEEIKSIREPIFITHSIVISKTTRSGSGNKLTITCDR